jgi:hypothetical protein
MDEPEIQPYNNRNFFLPLCLISLVFYSFYIVILGWSLTGPVRSLLELVLPAPTAAVFAGLSSLVIWIFFCFLSLAGAIQVVRELRARSLAWKTGLPLCIMISAIIFSGLLSGLLQLGTPNSAFQQILATVIFLEFALLPWCLLYLFSTVKKTKTEPFEIDGIQSISLWAGAFGLISTLLQICSELIYVHQAPGLYYDRMWDLGSPLELIGLLCFLIYVPFLLPVLGSYVLGLGLELRKIPPGPGRG